MHVRQQFAMREERELLIRYWYLRSDMLCRKISAHSTLRMPSPTRQLQLKAEMPKFRQIFFASAYSAQSLDYKFSG